jgi:hypothetical protein
MKKYLLHLLILILFDGGNNLLHKCVFNLPDERVGKIFHYRYQILRKSERWKI